ncbi:MAG: PKD domain-containing protein, partial [Flavobacteriales bacterium]
IATCTQSTDFPIVGGFQNSNKGGQEGCIVKMDNQLSSIIWSSYLGENADDAIYSLALDKDDNIYVTGGTASALFPTTANAYQTGHQDTLKADAFISLISSNGSQILYSSLYGSPAYDQSYFVEIGSTDAVYLFGQTKASDTTLVQNATYFESGAGQFIAVFTKDLSSILRATVVGTGKGSPDISPTAFLVDVCDKIYFSGWGSNLGGPLSTLNLPVSSTAFQSTTDGNDFYLMVVDDALSSMVYATYFGGSQSNEHVDGGTSRFDKKGIIYQSVCAGCGGSSDFPIEPNPGAVSVTNNSPNCNNGVFKFNFDFPMVIADFNTSWVGCDTNVSFQNLSISNSPITYQWDFGDATTSSLENPTHNYAQAGNYSVTLIATSSGACNVSDTITKQVYILANASDTIPSIVKCKNDLIQIG